MVKRFLATILALLTNAISAMNTGTEENWVSPIVFVGLAGDKLEQELHPGSTVSHALLVYGKPGDMVEQDNILPDDHLLESGREYRIVIKTFHNPLEYVQWLREKGKIRMSKNIGSQHHSAVGQKISCNGLDFIIVHELDEIEKVPDSICPHFVNGNFNIKLNCSQTFIDILLMIYYLANRKEIAPETSMLGKIMIDLGNVLDIAKNRETGPYTSIPFMFGPDIPFYEGFVDSMYEPNAITSQQKDNALQFLATAKKVRSILESVDPEGNIPRSELEALVMNYRSPEAGEPILQEPERVIVRRLFQEITYGPAP